MTKFSWIYTTWIIPDHSYPSSDADILVAGRKMKLQARLIGDIDGGFLDKCVGVGVM